MASSSCRHHFMSPTPHFFKVILPHTLTQGKLDVPKKFVRKHRDAFQTEEIFLRVASGQEQWKVGLKKTDEKVCFEKGWQEFVKFYSVECGHFLTFRYEGNFCFHVIIFDQSASEIEYPIAFQMPIKSESEEFEGDGPVKIKLKGNNINKKRRKDDKIAVADKTMKRSYQAKLLRNDQHLHYSSDLKDLKPQGIKLEEFSRKQPLSTATDQQGGITEKALKFKSRTKNPSFMVTMGPSYLHTGKGGCLSIPIGFANMHLKESKEIILKVSDGRIWKSWCSVRLSHGLNKFEMRSGWKAFSRDNNLKEGDICVFEFMETTQLILQVTIFQSTFSP